MNDFEKHLNTLLVEIFNSILKYEERFLSKKHSPPITVSEAHMIEFVGRFKEPSIGQLASLLGITPPSAPVAVKKLERKGILERVQNSADGRKTNVHLTEIGQRIDRVHNLFHRQLVRTISKQFTDGEQKVLMTAVQTISKFFRDIEIKEKAHSYEF